MQMEQILLCSDASHARNEGILLKLAQRAHSATRKGRAGIEIGNFEDKSMFKPKRCCLNLVLDTCCLNTLLIVNVT